MSRELNRKISPPLSADSYFAALAWGYMTGPKHPQGVQEKKEDRAFFRLGLEGTRKRSEAAVCGVDLFFFGRVSSSCKFLFIRDRVTRQAIENRPSKRIGRPRPSSECRAARDT